MKIAVVGAGGIGGFFGGCLARAGEDVTFIARGAHLEAIRARGLRVESASAGEFTIRPAQATDRPGEVGPVDLILFCVKSWDLDSAAQEIRPLVGPATAIIPLLNGVDAASRISSRVGDSHVLGGIAHIESTIAEPGLIRHLSPNLHRLTFGELDGSRSDRVGKIADVLRKGGFDVVSTVSIRRDLWEKFIFICGFAGISAITRLPASVIRSTPETRDLVERVMREVDAVGRAHGVPLDGDVVTAQLARLDLLPPGSKASMARDLERGRRLEIEALNGAVVRLGRERSVPTPVNDLIRSALIPYADGPPAS